LTNATHVHRLAVNDLSVKQVLDTGAAEYKDDGFVKVRDQRLFASVDGRLGVALSKKASGELALVQWDLTTGKVAHRVKLEPGSELVGVAGDGRRAVVRRADKKLVQVWDLVGEKLAVTSSIGTGHFPKDDVFLDHSPFLEDHKTYCLRVFNLPEGDSNARWAWQYFDAETGKPVDVGTDQYVEYDAASGMWLRARDGLVKQTGWELVKRVGRDAPIHARLSLSPSYKVRRACFVPGKGQVACYCETDAESLEMRRIIQVFEVRTGSLYGEVNRPTDLQLDGSSLVPSSNGAGLLFLSKVGKEDRLEMWKISPRTVLIPKKKPTSPAKDKVDSTKAF
jgi:hypothetical protein